MIKHLTMIADYLYNYKQESLVNMTFKLINTEIKTNIDINIHMTTEEFIKYVSEHVREDFNINKNYKIQIVKPENTDYLLRNDPEYAPTLRSTKLTLYEIYGDDLIKDSTFYIRPTLGLYVNVKLINSLKKSINEENEKSYEV